MNNIEVVGLGALNIDNIHKVEGILGDGETVENKEQVERIPGYREAAVNRVGAFPGGSAANTIYGLAKLGVSTGFIGAVGDDSKGKLLQQDFQKVGVDTSQIKVKPKAKTGSVLCLSDKLGQRSLHVLPGANSLLTIGDLDLTYVNRSKILHLSSFADDNQLKILLELVDKLESSVKLSFAPGALYAAKGQKALSPILSRTYLLFLNQDEIRQLTGQDVAAGARSCLEQGSHIVVVTLGKGAGHRIVSDVAYIRDAENEYTIESDNRNRISAIDTTGAGDAFTAGFLYGLLKEKSLEECGHTGDIVARFSITKPGARQGLPNLSELARRYQELYNKQL